MWRAEEYHNSAGDEAEEGCLYGVCQRVPAGRKHVQVSIASLIGTDESMTRARS
jgi:hypothetical protein